MPIGPCDVPLRRHASGGKGSFSQRWGTRDHGCDRNPVTAPACAVTLDWGFSRSNHHKQWLKGQEMSHLPQYAKPAFHRRCWNADKHQGMGSRLSTSNPRSTRSQLWALPHNSALTGHGRQLSPRSGVGVGRLQARWLS